MHYHTKQVLWYIKFLNVSMCGTVTIIVISQTPFSQIIILIIVISQTLFWSMSRLRKQEKCKIPSILTWKRKQKTWTNIVAFKINVAKKPMLTMKRQLPRLFHSDTRLNFIVQSAKQKKILKWLWCTRSCNFCSGKSFVCLYVKKCPILTHRFLPDSLLLNWAYGGWLIRKIISV